MKKQTEDDRHQLTARLEGLAVQARVLRETVASTLERAAELRSATARLRMESRALRGDALRVTLPRDPTCGARARRLLEEYLDGHSDEVVSDALTVASELINNAYRHGEGAIELKVDALGSIRRQHPRLGGVAGRPRAS